MNTRAIKKNCRGLVALAGLLFLLVVPHAVAAANNEYQVLQADINGDGCPDYLILAPRRWVSIPIDEDLIVPISVSDPKESLLIVSSSNCQYSSSRPPTQIEIARTDWVVSSYSINYGNVLGNDSSSFLIVPPNSTTAPTFSIVNRGNGQGLEMLQAITLQSQFPGVVATLSLQKIDGDTRSDLVLRSAGGILAVFLANPEGKFSTGPLDTVFVAVLVWKEYTDALSRGDVPTALRYVSSRVRDSFSVALSQPDSDPVGYARDVKHMDVIEVGSNWSRAAVTFNRNGQEQMFYVMFGVESDGTWRIASI